MEIHSCRHICTGCSKDPLQKERVRIKTVYYQQHDLGRRVNKQLLYKKIRCIINNKENGYLKRVLLACNAELLISSNRPLYNTSSIHEVQINGAEIFVKAHPS